VDYLSSKQQRFAELKPSANGRLQAEWRLTDASLLDTVGLTIPPSHVLPIIFVPGIMGSNLCNLRAEPVWLLNETGNIPTNLVWYWVAKQAGARQAVLHPARTSVYSLGAVPKGNSQSENNTEVYLRRGWGEVSEASYHKFLLWLENKMNGEANPADWKDFHNSSLSSSGVADISQSARTLPKGLIMKMLGLPDIAEQGHIVDPITSDELLKRSKFSFPIYAFGYNWLASNKDAGRRLKVRIEQVISENSTADIKCSQVILVTHSMGGLVARACCQLPDMSRKIAGVVHGVMPSTGAAVAYRRCKVGMKDEDAVAGLVIGSTGKDVTAVFSQSPGALQLLPAANYGEKWLEICDQSGKTVTALPLKDPYEEIYLERKKWWGLVREEWLSPKDGMPISWDVYSVNVKQAREFHRNIENAFHHNTYAFYGGGSEKGSFAKVVWKIKKGVPPERLNTTPAVAEISGLHHGSIRTDGSNNLYVGGETITKTVGKGDAPLLVTVETSYWEIRCERHDSAGDGTVPSRSGQDPRKSAGRSLLQQFELAGIQHEPAYKKYPVAQCVAYYAITKLAAKADYS
jgi:hypothetical protein